jgi:D-3-phosphoglycerate dehydrogenase
MTGNRIVVSESTGFAPEAAAALTRIGQVTWGDFDRASLLQSAAAADVLWVRLRHIVDEEIMNAAPKLRWIASPTTGLNHIDLKAAASRGIQVVSLRGHVEFLANIRATAELTIALMLSLLRRIPDAVDHTRAGGWNRDLFRGSELYRRTVGIVGLGRLGSIVSRYLVAFGAQVLATDRRAVEAESGVTLVGLAELLERSDIVTLHADLTLENSGFFDRSCFEQMKPGSYLVNTARGELIAEAPLLETLKSGRLSGAALDVTSDEWGADRARHPLVAYARQNSNLLLTPHIGGFTAESLSQAEIFLADMVTRALAESNSTSLCTVGNS